MDEATTNGAAEMNLPPSAFECSDDSTSAEVAACAHSKYASIIYITGQRCFWLLTEKALDAIQKSTGSLSSIMKNESLDKRIEGLEALGLTDLFVPPHPRSFLPPMLQDEWRSLENEIESKNNQLKTLFQHRNDLNKNYKVLYASQLAEGADHREISEARLSHAGDVTRTISDESRLIAETGKRERRIDELSGLGFSAAENAGFVIENGIMFSPHTRTVKQLLKDYRHRRSVFESMTPFDPEHYDLFQRFCIHNGSQVECQITPDHKDLPSIERYLEKFTRLPQHLKLYLDSVLNLANNGIAVPEYVLSTGYDDIKKGIERLDKYHSIERDFRKAETELQETVEQWTKALGTHGPIPNIELERLRRLVEREQDRLTQFRQSLEIANRNIKPARLFVWDPEDFEAQPYKALIKPGMPLREYTKIGSDVTGHFNLADLPGVERRLTGAHPLPKHEVYKEETAESIALSLRKAQSPGQDFVLEEVLEAMGCQKVSLNKKWYSDLGLFQPEIFYQQIQKEYKISALDSQEKKDAWGRQLQNMLFEEDAKKHLMLFDDSYTAQFTRLVLGSIDGDLGQYIREKTEITVLTGTDGPASDAGMSLKKGERAPSYSLAEARIGTELTFLKGDVNLLDIRLPDPKDALPVCVPYQSTNGVGEMNIGRFYCTLNVKLSGFASASALLSSTLAIEAQHRKGLTVSGFNRQGGEGEALKFKAFAGIQAGILASTSIYWSVPENIRKRINFTRTENPVEEWFNTGKLKGELSGTFGAGAELVFNLSMHNGRLIYKTKASATLGPGAKGELAFEVDFKAIPFWMAIVQNELHENDFSKIEWLTPDAFDFLRNLNYLFMTTALDISFWAARGKTIAQSAFDSINKSGRAGMVALRITRAMAGTPQGLSLKEYENWFRGLQPEAIGPLFNHLVAEPRALKVPGETEFNPDEVLSMQQRSLLQCTSWIRGKSPLVEVSARNQFKKMLVRMNMLGVKEEESLLDNLTRIDSFMNRKRSDRDDLRRLEYLEFKRITNDLTS